MTIENSVGDTCYGTKIGPRAVIAIFDCVNNLGMVGWEWLQLVAYKDVGDFKPLTNLLPLSNW